MDENNRAHDSVPTDNYEPHGYGLSYSEFVSHLAHRRMLVV